MAANTEESDRDDTLAVDEERPPLAYRTDRFAFRNSRTPFVFVENNPFSMIATDRESIRENPDPQRTIADVRHQYYGIEAGDIEESERVIRELIDQFDADDEQRFYYTLAGTRAQISGNGLDDYFDAIGNIRTSYRDLEEQLEPATGRQQPGFPHQIMRVRCIGLTYVEGFWLRFTIWLTESEKSETYSDTTLAITSLEQHGPLETIWLQSCLDHPAVGEPSSVDQQHKTQHMSFSLGQEPLQNVKEHRLIGYSGDETIEYITATNPCYRVDQSERELLYQQLKEDDVPNAIAHQLPEIERLPFRPRGGSTGIEEDVFVGGLLTFSQFGSSSSGVMLVSGRVNPMEKEKYESDFAHRHRKTGDRRGFGLIDRLRP